MSTVKVCEGSWTNSCQDQLTGSRTNPSIENRHWSSGMRGVGPAERTGKSRTRYCPGGMRPAAPSCRRLPVKPREMKFPTMALLPFATQRYAYFRPEIAGPAREADAPPGAWASVGGLAHQRGVRPDIAGSLRQPLDDDGGAVGDDLAHVVAGRGGVEARPDDRVRAEH